MAIGLWAGYLLLIQTSWQSSASTHTIAEALIALTAFIVGAMALLRYNAIKDQIYLYVGIGFAGAGLLDAYAAIVTSPRFGLGDPADVAATLPVIWTISRFFLSGCLFFGWIRWRRERRLKDDDEIAKRPLYTFLASLVLGTTIIVAVMIAPYYLMAELTVTRPVEFIPGVLLGLTLVGLLFADDWKDDYFYHWLVIALILGFFVQAMVSPGSQGLYDFQFYVAHMAKLASYLSVLTGLILSIFIVFGREVASAERLNDVVDNVGVGIVTIDQKGTILSINRAIRNIFGRLQGELVGKNIGILLADGSDDNLDDMITRYINTGDTTVIDTLHEIEGVRYNGRTFPLELAVTRLDYASGPVFLGAMRDITERLEMDRMKSEFVATVSHELRTPLTVILGYLPLLKDPDKLPESEAIAKMAISMNRSGEHLLALVTDLLDISKIEAGKLELLKVSVNAHQVINEVIDIMKEPAAKKNTRLVMDADEGIVHADETRLKQILINLVGNAVKFTEDGEISVSAKISPRGAQFTVRDNGIGIHGDQLNAIFDRFRQIDGTQTRQSEGTGLGLAITRSLVELHGGHIRATSAVGHGTQFIFDIPIAEQTGFN